MILFFVKEPSKEVRTNIEQTSKEEYFFDSKKVLNFTDFVRL